MKRLFLGLSGAILALAVLATPTRAATIATNTNTDDSSVAISHADKDFSFGLMNDNYFFGGNAVFTSINTGYNEDPTVQQGIIDGDWWFIPWLWNWYHWLIDHPSIPPFDGDGGIGPVGTSSLLDPVVSGNIFVNVEVDNAVNTNRLGAAITVGGPTMASNNVTTDHSFAFAWADQSIDIGVDNFNRAFVGNLVVTGANTGWNDVSGDGYIQSGDVVVLVDGENMVNTNVTGIYGTIGGPTIASNYWTKRYSDAWAWAFSDTSIDVDNMNFALAANIVVTEADTGNNYVDGDGWIISGGIYSDVYAGNMVNTNLTGISGNVGGSTVASNTITTDESDAWAWAESSTSVSVSNYNGAMVGNLVYTGANTGGNDVDDGGWISSGNATSIVDAENLVNSNGTTITGSVGGPTVATNNVTDNGSSATATANSSSSTSVSNSNGALVGNIIVSDVNTGDNSTGGGVVVSGNGTVVATVDNTVNTNETTITNTGGGATIAQNTATTDGSTAVAGATSTQSTSVTNTNDATVANVVVSGVNTGNNDGSSSTVVSGNASTTVTGSNVANSNTTTVVIGE